MRVDQIREPWTVFLNSIRFEPSLNKSTQINEVSALRSLDQITNAYTKTQIELIRIDDEAESNWNRSGM